MIKVLDVLQDEETITARFSNGAMGIFDALSSVDENNNQYWPLLEWKTQGHTVFVRPESNSQ